MLTTQSRFSVKSLLSVAAIALFSSMAMAEDVRQSYDVEAGGTLSLETDSGKLIIKSHNKDTVEIDVEIDGSDADEFEVSHSSDGKNVEIIGEKENSGGWGWNGLKVVFEITVPEEYNLDIRTAGGSIRIEDLTGQVDARTSGGSIKVQDITGDVDLHTSGGSIKTGSINGDLNAHTSGGSITAKFAQQLSDDAVLDTSGGSITVKMIPDMKVDLDASTSGGRVRTEFDVDGRIKKKSIRGEINGGGPRLKLHTSGGSITIEEL